MNFGDPTPEVESIDMINRDIETGINIIDTANVYSQGESERIVGKALRQNGRREEVVLATKVYSSMGDGPNERDLSRYHIIKACEDSLRRLDTARIDLYQLHRPSEWVPQEETLRALDDLETGQEIRHIGNHDALRTRVEISPDGKLMLTSGMNGVLKLWDLENAELIRQFGYAEPAIIFDIAMSPDGTTVQSG